ncbi:3-oxoacyl-ACP synthase [Sphingomonas sp. AR_OL41]|uniref:3-oxoacyl-ACP synthase n=1 Tax=Sphingomonas sp. AR_OL41 TaxID=3042729 RepID=UPI00247FC0CA|nr:3-oxoacyl-ACP synthase [Sphingomonas sp. AR_OL41]MDH7971585.1 3-oxoacyl-ACP synthase [Sphingomonas sp. AR_OL41]
MNDTSGSGGASRLRCFDVARRLEQPVSTPLRLQLDSRPAAALAALLPLLGCGEEAAGIAFDGLAECHSGDDRAAPTLRAIAEEERLHDMLIRQLERGLPEARQDTFQIESARRFHIGLVRGGAALHLARIAALDAAVCTMFGRLLRPGGPIAADPEVTSILRRIHRDEARHVRVARRLALETGSAPALRDAAAAARDGLADILLLARDAFEDMKVDPASLGRDIRRLPDGLLVA